MDPARISDIAAGRKETVHFRELKYALEHCRAKPREAFELYRLYGSYWSYWKKAMRLIATDESRCLSADDFFLLLMDLRFGRDTIRPILATWDLRETFTKATLALVKPPSLMEEWDLRETLTPATLAATKARFLPEWLAETIRIFHVMPRVSKHIIAVQLGDSRESPAHLYVTLRLLECGLLQPCACHVVDVKFARFIAITSRLPDELRQLICCRAMCFKEFEHRSWSRCEWIREESYGNAMLLWLHQNRKKSGGCTLL
jgi:hypothetical protein